VGPESAIHCEHGALVAINLPAVIGILDHAGQPLYL
jgi:hypothetical protein